MITKWKLANFKSVKDETTLDFAPLTIFAGTNSSGKSTLLQSILLISQTLSHKDPTRQIVLNGNFIQLGEFSDIKSTDGASDQIVIGWELKPPKENIRDGRPDVEEISLISCEIVFGIDHSKSNQKLSTFSLKPTLSSIELTVQKHNADNKVHQCSLNAVRSVEETKNEKKETLRGNPYSDAVSSTLDYDIQLNRTSCQGSGNSEEINDREILYRAKLVRYHITNPSFLNVNPEQSFGYIHENEILYRSEPIGCFFSHFLPDRITTLVETEVERIEAIRNVILRDRVECPFDFICDEPINIPLKITSCIREIMSNIDQDDYDTYEKLVIKDRESPDAIGEPSIHPSLEELVDELLLLLDDESVTTDDLWEILSEGDFISSFVFRDVVMNKLNRSQKFQGLLDEMIQEVRLNGNVKPMLLELPINEDKGYLKSFFTDYVRYIGPLRTDPVPSYPILSMFDLEDVGLKGENTAAVFELQKKRIVKYLPSSLFDVPGNIPEVVNCSLEEAVVDWLCYLGVADNIASNDLAQFGHNVQIRLNRSLRNNDLTQVGVGVSQVLPIIVASLLAKSDATLIFEQPELHLHPKVQSRLADFFLSMTQLGKQCLVETHSEHIINRIRLRIAEATECSPWQEAAKVYFIEKKDGCSIFNEVHINKYGAIQDWPEGFFDEGFMETEKIIRATALKQHVKGRFN